MAATDSIIFRRRLSLKQPPASVTMARLKALNMISGDATFRAGKGEVHADQVGFE
jgi:hypothetical protein